MKRLALLVAVTLSFGVAGALAAAPVPRQEKLAPIPADQKRARAAVIKLSDLPAGWKADGATTSQTSPPDCPDQDFSAFTVTGLAGALFEKQGALVGSQVQLLPSAQQARGDFHAALVPDFAKCEGAELVKELGTSAKLVSAKRLANPRLGDLSFTEQYVVRLGRRLMYGDQAAFVKGRGIVTMIDINTGAPLPDRETLLKRMAARLQS